MLKCHPDKVQDAALKAIKQDEFQKVQQAYELLRDDTKRLQYDEQIKLFELRREMGRGNPTARSNPFEYEVRTAEPRPSSYGRPPPTNVYSHGSVPRSHEDVLYEERNRHEPKKSASYDSSAADQKRTAEKDARWRDELLREKKIRDDKIAEEERYARRERERDGKRQHSEKKKSRDKEKRRGAEDKRSRNGPFVEDDSDDGYSPRSSDKKSSRRNEEELRKRQEQHEREERELHFRAVDAARLAEAGRAQIKEAPMDEKWEQRKEFASAYQTAARRKGAAEAEPFHNPGLRRPEAYAPPSPAYNLRHAQPYYPEEEDSPRRSSGHKEPRRASETPSTSNRRERSRSRRSPSHSREPQIVNASPRTKPSLQSYNSAPPNLPRDKPSRSKTEDYPRHAPIPQMSRAQTFQVNDRGRDREHQSSGRKKGFSTSDSDSDVVYPSPRHSSSPPPRRQAETRYVVQDGRTVPTSRHRANIHNVNEYTTQERSESPLGTQGTARPPFLRNPPSSEARPRTANRSTSYYVAPEAPKPIIINNDREPRPHLKRGESSSRGAKYENIAFAPQYTAENIKYATSRPGPDLYERSRREADYYSSHGRSGVYG